MSPASTSRRTPPAASTCLGIQRGGSPLRLPALPPVDLASVGTDLGGTMLLGLGDLVVAHALAVALADAGLEASADIGQQGAPAVVVVQLPPDRRRAVRRLVLAAAQHVDPRARRLPVKEKRGASVRTAAIVSAVTVA